MFSSGHDQMGKETEQGPRGMGGPCEEVGVPTFLRWSLCPVSPQAAVRPSSTGKIALPPLKGSPTTTSSVLALPTPRASTHAELGRQGLQDALVPGLHTEAQVVQQLR